MDLSQKTAYLKGLADGIGLTKNDVHGDFVKELLSCLNDMAEEIETVEEYIHDLTEELDLIDDCDDDLCDCDCDNFVETQCPVCGENIGYYKKFYDEPVEVLCPNCDNVVAVIGDDYDEDEDDEVVIDEELDEE